MWYEIYMETLRTRFRRPRESDWSFFLEMETDPDVYRHLPPGRPFTEEKVKERLRKFIAEEELHAPYGIWVAEDKTTGDFIAWVILMKMRHEHELGYVVRKKYWNQGYATEVVRGLIDFASEELPKIVAVTSQEHQSSIGVLEKIGFRFIKLVKDGDTHLNFYEYHKS